MQSAQTTITGLWQQWLSGVTLALSNGSNSIKVHMFQSHTSGCTSTRIQMFLSSKATVLHPTCICVWAKLDDDVLIALAQTLSNWGVHVDWSEARVYHLWQHPTDLSMPCHHALAIFHYPSVLARAWHYLQPLILVCTTGGSERAAFAPARERITTLPELGLAQAALQDAPSATCDQRMLCCSLISCHYRAAALHPLTSLFNVPRTTFCSH